MRSGRRISRAFVKYIVFAGILALGYSKKTCVAFSNDDGQNRTFDEMVCESMLTNSSTRAQQCQMGGAGDGYLEMLMKQCGSMEEGGFSSSCMASAGSSTGILGQEFFYDSVEEVMKVIYDLDAKIVDIRSPISVSFQYLATNSSTVDVSVNNQAVVTLDQSSTTNSWCVSSSVTVMATQQNTIQLSFESASPDSVHFGTAFLVFDSINNSVAAPNILSSSCSKSAAECDPTAGDDGDSTTCSCNIDDGDNGGLPSELWLLIPAAIFGSLALGYIGFFLTRCWRRRRSRNMSSDVDYQHHDMESVVNKKEFKRFSSSNEQPQFPTCDIKRTQLSNILENNRERHSFKEYVEANHPPESLLLYESIEQYEAIPSSQWRQNEAQRIISRFIAPGAPYIVPVSPQTQARVMQSKRFPVTLFAEAKMEAYSYMQLHFLESYLLYRGLSEQPEATEDDHEQPMTISTDESDQVIFEPIQPSPNQESKGIINV